MVGCIGGSVALCACVDVKCPYVVTCFGAHAFDLRLYNCTDLAAQTDRPACIFLSIVASARTIIKLIVIVVYLSKLI